MPLRTGRALRALHYDGVMRVRDPTANALRARPGRSRPLARLASLAALVLAACSPARTASDSQASPATAQPAVAELATAPPRRDPVLRVIAFNDFHGHLEPGTLSLALPDPARPGEALRVPVGGAAALGGLVRALRDGAAHSLVVASGDQIGATPLVSALFRHESTIEVLNEIGLDVATVGNHEFDAGRVELERVLAGGCAPAGADPAVQSCALHPYRGARFATIVANVRTRDGAALFAPSWVREFGGVKVGLVGAVTRTTPGIVVPSGVAGLQFVDEAEAINRAVQALKVQGVRAIVVTIHEGGELGSPQQPADWNDISCPGFRGAIVDIARRIDPEVDLILTAHTHQGYRCELDGRLLMQATSFGRGVSVVDLVLDARSGDVDRARTASRNLPVLNERTPSEQRETVVAAHSEPWRSALRAARPAAEVARQVASYVQAALPIARREVSRIAGGFDRQGRADSSAGRLIADAQLAATRDPARGGAQLALTNPGGIRTDLACAAPPCTVSYGDAFAMQPFGNSLVVMSLSGAELKALLESQQRPGRASPTMLSPSAGLAYRWRAAAPPGQRVENLSLNGAMVDPAAEVRVTVNSFMAEGGDEFNLLRQGRHRLGGMQDLDALIAWLKSSPAPVAAPRVEWVE